MISQSSINFIISQPAVPVSIYSGDPEKVVLNNYNIFIRRRDEPDKSKKIYIIINLLSLSDKKFINIETKDLNFTIFINKIYRYKYTHFDGAKNKLE